MSDKITFYLETKNFMHLLLLKTGLSLQCQVFININSAIDIIFIFITVVESFKPKSSVFIVSWWVWSHCFTVTQQHASNCEITSADAVGSVSNTVYSKSSLFASGHNYSPKRIKLFLKTALCSLCLWWPCSTVLGNHKANFSMHVWPIFKIKTDRYSVWATWLTV